MSSGGNIVWVGLALIGVALLAPSMPSGLRSVQTPDARAATSPDKPIEDESGDGSIASAAPRELVRAPDGHFYAEAQVNGARIRFLVDTGASIVALTPQDAQRAGIALPSERATARGVGGDVEVIPVTIDRLAIGTIEARDVRAAVAEELEVSLLGQSYLSRVGRVEISGDRMVLR
jgi:aspartyl protease family protein